MAGRRWKVILYTTDDGKQPVQDFLHSLLQVRKEDAYRLIEKFDHLENIGFQGARECELIRKVEGTDKIFRLKLWKTDLRVCLFLWSHARGQKCMVMASAEIKKEDELSPQTIRRAVDARADWFERHG